MVAHDSLVDIAADTPAANGLVAERWTLALVFLVLTAAALLPLALVDIPPLVDLPNHLARIHIMSGIDGDAALARNYEVTWRLVPNLAMEIVTAPLAGLLPAGILGRLFLGAAMLLVVGATLTLRRVLYGRTDLWSAAAFLFLYNQILVMGFVNYLFSLGLALLLLAGWIASRRMNPALRLGLFSAAAGILFFMHFFALAVYAVCVGSYEIGQHFRSLRQDWRRVAAVWAYGALQFLPIAILMLYTMPQIPNGGFYYGNHVMKLRAAWSPVLAYQRPTDLALLLFVVLVPVIAALKGKLSLAPALRTPLLILVPLAVAMPFWIKGAWGAVAYADLRLPIVIALLLVAGLKLSDVSRKTLFALACSAAVLFSARIYGVTDEWMRIDREFREFRAATAKIPEGASLLPMQLRHKYYPDGTVRYEFAFWHMPALAIVERGLFVPTLFTDATKQPVGVTPERRAIDTPFGRPVDLRRLEQGISGVGGTYGKPDDPFEAQPFWEGWPERYDYLLLTHFGQRANPAPAYLAPVHEGSFFTIFRVIPPAG